MGSITTQTRSGGQVDRLASRGSVIGGCVCSRCSRRSGSQQVCKPRPKHESTIRAPTVVEFKSLPAGQGLECAVQAGKPQVAVVP